MGETAECINHYLRNTYVISLHSNFYLEEFNDFFQQKYYEKLLSKIIISDYNTVPRYMNIPYITKIYQSYLHNILNYLRFLMIQYNEWRLMKLNIIKYIQKIYLNSMTFDPLLKRELFKQIPSFQSYFASVHSEYTMKSVLNGKEAIFDIFLQKIQNKLLFHHSEIYQNTMREIYTDLFNDLYPFLKKVCDLEWMQQFQYELEFV